MDRDEEGKERHFLALGFKDWLEKTHFFQREVMAFSRVGVHTV